MCHLSVASLYTFHELNNSIWQACFIFLICSVSFIKTRHLANANEINVMLTLTETYGSPHLDYAQLGVRTLKCSCLIGLLYLGGLV